VSINREREDVKLRVRRRLEYRDALKKERDALERERRRLEDQCGNSDMLSEELNFVRFQLRNVEEELEAIRAKGETLYALKEERDALRSETEKLRTQCKDKDLLEQKLSALTSERDRNIKGRDSCMQEVQIVQDDIDAIEKGNDALKVEVGKFRAQIKERVLLETKKNSMGSKNQDTKEKRNVLISKLQEMGEDEEAIRMDRDRLKLEVEELRDLRAASTQLRKQISDVRTQCVQVNRDRDALELKVRRRVERREALLKERDALERERRCLKAQSPDTEMLQDNLNLESTRLKNMEMEIARLTLKLETMETLKNDRDALKNEMEDLRTQSKDNALLEEQLYTLTLQLEKSATERHCYIREVQRVENGIDDLEGENDAIETDIEILRAQCKLRACLQTEANPSRVERAELRDTAKQ
jgi:chromosome segregation ATPase